MKKKLFICLLMVFAFMYAKPVFADSWEEYYVCSNPDNCDYASLDAVLTDLATKPAFDPDDSTYYWIGLDQDVEHSITSDYVINVPIGFFNYSEEYNAKELVVDGNGHTLSLSSDFEFEVGCSITIKDITLRFIGNDLDDYWDYFVWGSSEKNVTFTNVKIISNVGYESCYSYPQGLYVNSSNTLLSNVTVKGFPIGVSAFSPYDSLVIKGSDLSDNFSSLAVATNEARVENTLLSRVMVNSFSRPDINNETILTVESLKYSFINSTDLKVKMIRDEDFPDEHDETICSSYNEKAIYYLYNEEDDIFPEIIVEKNNEININKEKNIDNILAYFKLNELDNNEFTVTSSNPDVAKVDGYKVSFLKTGVVTITAVNNDTHESYRINFNVFVPIPDNPGTGQTIISILAIVLVVGVVSIIIRKRKNREQ